MIKIGKHTPDWMTYSFHPETKDELKEIIENRISNEGPECDLNDIDVSLMPDMSWFFAYSEFNGNISNWDVSNVKDMSGMFFTSCFTGNLSKWNVSSVTNMKGMFAKSKFNGDISNWNINKDCDTRTIFTWCRIKKRVQT